MKQKRNNKLLYLILIGLLFLLAIILFVLSFFVDEEKVNRLSLFSSMAIGLATLLCALASFYISYLGEKRANMDRNQQIETNARRFIIENSNEIYNLPLCLMAYSYDKFRKYDRKIYREFNILTKDEKISVLKQLNYNYELIENNDWIDKGIEKVKEFIASNELGRDFLYDDAKYYKKSMLYHNEIYDSKYEYVHDFPDNFSATPKFKVLNEKDAQYEGIDFCSYLYDYYNSRKNESHLYKMHKEEKPVDLLIEIKNLRQCDEMMVCYWMMMLVDCVCHLINGEHKVDVFVDQVSIGDAEIDTFEDRYLGSLLTLYNMVNGPKNITEGNEVNS